MELLYNHFLKKFEADVDTACCSERRIGSELKFPLVNRDDGRAASFDSVCALWRYLEERGWEPVRDSLTGNTVGARKPGEHNDTVASCETGFCKVEFSLAHVGNLHDLEDAISGLREEIRGFVDQEGLHLLGYGIQPVTEPSNRLLMKKSRTSVWGEMFRSNRHIDEKDGHDMHLFTVNAASHVHVSVASQQEAVRAVNVLNGFSGAQIALTADSNIWRGRIDPDYKCVAEKFWDWWMPDSNRVGVPETPFEKMEDYVHTVAALRPVYVKRAGKPIVLKKYRTFAEYYGEGRAVGIDADGREVSFLPDSSDIDLHDTCYWYNARLSRYSTVENRVNDQQPPDDLVCIAALTLGLVNALPEAGEELSRFDWDELRAARDIACRSAIRGSTDTFTLREFAERMLILATLGLRRRELGEERFLAPLWRRFMERECPADGAASLFKSGGIEALLEQRAF